MGVSLSAASADDDPGPRAEPLCREDDTDDDCLEETTTTPSSSDSDVPVGGVAPSEDVPAAGVANGSDEEGWVPSFNPGSAKFGRVKKSAIVPIVESPVRRCRQVRLTPIVDGTLATSDDGGDGEELGPGELCFICYNGNGDVFSVCECAGRFVHLECQRKMMAACATHAEGTCAVCKAPYTNVVMHEQGGRRLTEHGRSFCTSIMIAAFLVAFGVVLLHSGIVNAPKPATSDCNDVNMDVNVSACMYDTTPQAPPPAPPPDDGWGDPPGGDMRNASDLCVALGIILFVASAVCVCASLMVPRMDLNERCPWTWAAWKRIFCENWKESHPYPVHPKTREGTPFGQHDKVGPHRGPSTRAILEAVATV